MKKILMLLMLTLFYVTSFGQVRHARATDLSYGEKTQDGTVNWKTSISVDVLIELGVKKVTIYSSTSQEFHIINYKGEVGNGTSKWFCSDLSGANCNLFITATDSKTGVFTVGIEYSDLIYYYVCKLE
jgi:hypothetical protein